MKRFQNILCPTDFSERAALAQNVARALARDEGAKLILLFVEPIETLHAGGIPVPMDPRVYKDAMEDIRQQMEGPDLKFPIETHLYRGDAATQIVEAARTLRADLIVLGTHGRTGLSRLLMGSVAEWVMRTAPCPVLTVKGATALPDTSVGHQPLEATHR